jgi:hypothetical protein
MFLINLIKGLLGGAGVLQQNVPYKKTDFESFAKDLTPGSVVLTRDRTPGFFGGGIQAVTGSPWQHALLYIGKSTGEMMRDEFPELCGPRHFIFQGNKTPLFNLPQSVFMREALEASWKVSILTLDKYNSDDNQLLAYSRALTAQQLKQVLFRAYLLYGMPYDIQEIASHVLPVANPAAWNFPIKIITNAGEYDAEFLTCASLVSYAYRPVEIISGEKVNTSNATPGGVAKALAKKDWWSTKRFNF